MLPPSKEKLHVGEQQMVEGPHGVHLPELGVTELRSPSCEADAPTI